MTTLTADIWTRPDIAETVEFMRGKSIEELYVFTVGMIEGLHRGYWTPEQKCERTVAILAAADVVRAEQAEARP